MRTIIKNTKTIAEYKELKAKMETVAEQQAEQQGKSLADIEKVYLNSKNEIIVEFKE